MSEFHSLLVHLRLHFQLLLAPLFLFGYAQGGGTFTVSLAVAFIAFHVFLYGGTTAFNSAYDRDEGPVGGLFAPPPVSPWQLPFSLVVQAFGALLVALVSLEATAVYLLMAAMGAAYSHPLTRWKASPLTALPTIAIGQGVLGFLAGVATTDAGLAGLDRTLLLGAIGAALVVTGFYPLSSLFQIEEDRRRGDRSVAVAWGSDAAFGLAIVAFLIASFALESAAAQRYGTVDAVLLAAGPLLLAAVVFVWQRRFDPAAVRRNFLIAMRLNAIAASGFAIYLLGRIALNG